MKDMTTFAGIVEALALAEKNLAACDAQLVAARKTLAEFRSTGGVADDMKPARQVEAMAVHRRRQAQAVLESARLWHTVALEQKATLAKFDSALAAAKKVDAELTADALAFLTSFSEKLATAETGRFAELRAAWGGINYAARSTLQLDAPPASHLNFGGVAPGDLSALLQRVLRAALLASRVPTPQPDCATPNAGMRYPPEGAHFEITKDEVSIRLPHLVTH